MQKATVEEGSFIYLCTDLSSQHAVVEAILPHFTVMPFLYVRHQGHHSVPAE